jgi:hypothetical protein
MSLVQTLQFQAFAAAGVALLVGLSFALGFRARARIEDLQYLAPTTPLVETVLDADGRAGVGLTADGRLLLAKVMGADIAVRTTPLSAVSRIAIKGEDVVLHLADLGFPKVRLRASPPPLWLGRLAK